MVPRVDVLLAQVVPSTFFLGTGRELVNLVFGIWFFVCMVYLEFFLNG